jgi:hypothetical protein
MSSPGGSTSRGRLRARDVHPRTAFGASLKPVPLVERRAASSREELHVLHATPARLAHESLKDLPTDALAARPLGHDHVGHERVQCGNGYWGASGPNWTATSAGANLGTGVMDAALARRDISSTRTSCSPSAIAANAASATTCGVSFGP